MNTCRYSSHFCVSLGEESESGPGPFSEVIERPCLPQCGRNGRDAAGAGYGDLRALAQLQSRGRLRRCQGAVWCYIWAVTAVVIAIPGTRYI